jgi:hypothetical protein
MIKYINQINIFVLILILFGGLSSFILLKGNQFAQLVVGIVISVSYACWGILFHWLDKSLHRKVVVEYILIAAIAIMVLFVVIRV